MHYAIIVHHIIPACLIRLHLLFIFKHLYYFVILVVVCISGFLDRTHKLDLQLSSYFSKIAKDR